MNKAMEGFDKMTVVDYINGNSPLSETARSVFMHMRLYYPWNRYSMWKQRKEKVVPKSMIEAREFFEANQLRIDYISSFLADEKSRDTFHKLIHMRQYYETSDIPQYNYFDQYFPRDIICFDENEVFVDGGGFTGDTLLKFRKLCPNYKKIITFEPDQKNILYMKKKCRNVRDLKIIEAGMSDIDGGGSFRQDATGMYSSFVQENTGLTIPLVKMDSLNECKDATFIKMDIEGFEMNALRGGKEIIKTRKPKLAICIYHSNEDMLRIAEYVHELVPEYKIYMRAHNMGIAENVLYAIV